MTSWGDELSVAISTAASGNSILVAGVANKRIRVTGYAVVAAAAVNAKFQGTGSATVDLTGALPLAANSGVVSSGGPAQQFAVAQGDALNINLSAAVQVSGHLTYVLV